MTPLVLNPIPNASRWEDLALTLDMETEPPPRLPTPEERMRQQAQAVAAAVVPINITGLDQDPDFNFGTLLEKRIPDFVSSVSGESFDRQASFRRVASNNDSLSRRYCNLSRRKTVTGVTGVTGVPPEPTQTSTDLILSFKALAVIV